MFSGREEDFHVWAKKVENHVAGVFQNVRELRRLQQSRKTWSQQQQLRLECLNLKQNYLMGAIVRLEDLVTRYCGRRDAQGNVHGLAEDIPHEFP